jgi:8-oxo-dGTP pyrophosphatase MutT (NUDIX family)
MMRFFDGLKKSLVNLPGEDCHLEVSPLGRKKSSEVLKDAVNPKLSAVSIVLFEDSQFPNTILIERAIYKGSHSGQISFPGGKKDQQDKSLLDTAVRETHEEIGLLPSALDLIGSLTPVYIPVSNFLVQPYVFMHSGRPELTLDSREVVDAFSFSLHRLREDCLKETSIDVDEKIKLKNVPFFDIENKVVWGATALMINELRAMILRDNLL